MRLIAFGRVHNRLKNGEGGGGGGGGPVHTNSRENRVLRVFRVLKWNDCHFRGLDFCVILQLINQKIIIKHNTT